MGESAAAERHNVKSTKRTRDSFEIFDVRCRLRPGLVVYFSFLLQLKYFDLASSNLSIMNQLLDLTWKALPSLAAIALFQEHNNTASSVVPGESRGGVQQGISFCCKTLEMVVYIDSKLVFRVLGI